jgi:hypothetical protein
MQHEFGMRYGQTSIIRFGYWDSLRKGLLAGERLTLDLRRLETAFLEGDVREYELTKHFSLLSLAPEQLIALKDAGSCEFEVPEWVFDLDTSGHFLRRLKSVSVTIPCVIGPYTTIHAKLLLLKSSYRQNTDVAPGYPRAADDDPRFVDDRKVLESVVTSTAQNDPGVFDAGGRDERYQPFEGGGAISRWRLELPTDFEMFDYGTISDVILHLRYTARDGGDAFKASAVATLKSVLKNGQELRRLFSLRHEFPSEWRGFVNSPSAAVRSITVNFVAERFPYFVQRRTISIKKTTVFAALQSGGEASAAIVPGTVPPSDVTAGPVWDGVASPSPFTVGMDGDPKNISDVFVVVQFST